MVKSAALKDLALLQSVVESKERFYPRGWARYDLARPGTIKLMPPGHVLPALKRDYEQMRIMIYGTQQPFDEMMSGIQSLESEINALQ